MAGFESAKQPPPNPAGKWRVTSCTTVASGEVATIDGGIDYYLADTSSGPALYEFMSGGGSGSKMANHFEADDGTHFVLYVRTSHGYEFVIPKNRSEPGERLVYLAGSFKAYRDADDAPMKLRGTAQVRCEMVPAST